MKEKIESRLKTKFANLGFSPKAIAGVAESLVATGLVTDENLDTVVEGQKSALVAMQSEIDSRVTSAIEKAKSEAAKTTANADGGGNPAEPVPSKSTFDPEAFGRSLLEQVEAKLNSVTTKVQSIEAQTVAEKRRSTIAMKAKNLGIPETRLVGVVISKDDEIDSTLAQIKEAMTKEGLGKTPLLFGGGDGGDKVSDAVQNRIERHKSAQQYTPPVIQGLKTKE